jgi:DNA-binding transcriptional LysR family regulator
MNVRNVVEVDSIEAIALMVAQGTGVAIVPDTPCIAQLKLSLAMIDLGEQTFYRHIGLVARVDGAKQHLVNVLGQALASPDKGN